MHLSQLLQQHSKSAFRKTKQYRAPAGRQDVPSSGLTAQHKLNLGMKPKPGSTESDCQLSKSLTDPQVEEDAR